MSKTQRQDTESTEEQTQDSAFFGDLLGDREPPTEQEDFEDGIGSFSELGTGNIVIGEEPELDDDVDLGFLMGEAIRSAQSARPFQAMRDHSEEC